MPRVAVTPIKSVSPHGAGPGAGIAAKAADATEFNSFVNTGRTYLVVNNTSVATKTLKLKSSAGTQINATWTLPASKSIVVGPFPVFQDFAEVVNVDANSAEVTFLVAELPRFDSAIR